MFRSADHDICFNFAAENSLVNSPVDDILFLWLNNTTVTIGRHQNAWKECKLAELEKDGVRLVRRLSGGGAVMQDMGCLTFTLISNHTAEQDLKSFTEKNFALILAGLERAGISGCTLSGRNDIVWHDGRDNYKISGSAFKQLASSTGRPRLLHHGTLLFDTDFTRLGRYLTPNKLKLQAKGIQSVQSRVKNLKDIGQGALTLQMLQESVEQEFWARRGGGGPPIGSSTRITSDSELLTADPSFTSFIEKISDWNFRFGQTPEFSHKMGPVRLEKGEGVAFGMFELHLQVTKGVITRSVTFSDSLMPDTITHLNDHLHGVKYEREAVQKKLAELSRTPDETAMLKAFGDWAGKQIQDE